MLVAVSMRGERGEHLIVGKLSRNYFLHHPTITRSNIVKLRVLALI
jgi:hypothetical protein